MPPYWGNGKEGWVELKRGEWGRLVNKGDELAKERKAKRKRKVGIGPTKNKGWERALEINQIGQTQLAQRRNQCKKGCDGNGVKTLQKDSKDQRKEPGEKGN